MARLLRLSSLSLLLGGLLGEGEALIIPRDVHLSGLVHGKLGLADLLNDTIMDPVVLNKRDGNPADFGWIKKWAAVGDSFTAGIGAGSPLGSALSSRADWECSRYDRSYVKVLDRAFGETGFQFVACSGDRTEDIYAQVQNLDGDLNLVMMTAGGNDLCLVRSFSDMLSFFFPRSQALP